MSEPSGVKRLVVHEDAVTLTSAVASLFLDRLRETTADGSSTHVALTGGSSGIGVLRAAGRDARRTEIDWSLVHFWWGDERFVPADSADRNERQARDAFLSLIDVPEQNVHAMTASDQGISLDDGATAYAAELTRFGEGDGSYPVFDVCFLGIGPDAHVASLFPDRGEISVVDRSVVAVRNSPKPPPERISLTLPVINASVHVWLVMAGEDKAAALRAALALTDGRTAPASAVSGRVETVYFADAAAAREVPAELIGRDE